MQTTHDIKGRLTILKYDADGNLVDERNANNSIATAGRKLVADLFKFNILGDEEDKINRITHIHMGGSKTAFKANQKGLQDKIGGNNHRECRVCAYRR